MKRVLTVLFLFAVIVSSANEQDKKKYETIKIKTSAVCNMCKERLEHNMSFEKGVKTVELKVNTQVLTITYKPEKTNAEKLKKAVTKIGYDADELEADPKAYTKLPACCKKDNPIH